MAVTPNRHHTEVTDTPTRKATAKKLMKNSHKCKLTATPSMQTMM
jgi:hypothetical protein